MRVITTLISLLLVATSVHATDDSTSDALLKLLADDNHFALLRHALAPGTGDPVQFEVDDCTTQRNLNPAGRTQAKNIGQTLNKIGISQARIYSSQWCRCLETARLLQLGQVAELPQLNSFFQNRQDQEKQTQELRLWLQNQKLEEPLILVTHQVNITALTGVYPASGELVIVKKSTDQQLQVIGSVDTLNP